VGLTSLKVPAAKNFALHMQDVVNEATKQVQRQKSYNLLIIRDVKLLMMWEQKSYLSTTSIWLKTLRARKSLPRWIGPVTMRAKVGVVEYKLEFPNMSIFHNVFRVSLLKPYTLNVIISHHQS
jgi:hypothetical protein